jgi:hypothetical protein
MANRLGDVMPPTIIETGKRHRLNSPNTMIQTIQPETVPAVLVFMIAPWKLKIHEFT